VARHRRTACSSKAGFAAVGAFTNGDLDQWKGGIGGDYRQVSLGCPLCVQDGERSLELGRSADKPLGCHDISGMAHDEGAASAGAWASNEVDSR
jgi:hypothetical protein